MRVSRLYALLVSRSPHLLVSGLLLGFLALYGRTSAPSVLSGDSAEFQFAAPLLGVPHPTTYPLYVLLGKLATLAIPLYDLARRVTLVSAGCAALAVALFFLLARRLGLSTPAATIAALALGFAPGLWNVATLAEVYALLMLLLAALAWLIAPASDERRPTTNDEDSISSFIVHRSSFLSPCHLVTVSPCQETGHLVTSSGSSWWRARCAAFLAGLGFTHHGLFVLAGLPLFLGYVAALALTGDDRRSTTDHRPPKNETPSAEGSETGSHRSAFSVQRSPGAQRSAFSVQHSPDAHRSAFSVQRSAQLKQLAILALCFAAGLAPWLFPLIQYARYGPFAGLNYGLPRHYFWGSPASWGAVIDLLTGGPLRRGIFRLPSPEAALETLRLVGGRLLFEFGPIGLALGLLGCAALWRRSRAAWLGAAWIFLIIAIYLLLLGPAVEDAPVFTLPMLLPWALWVAAGVEVIGVQRAAVFTTKTQRSRSLRVLRAFVVKLSGHVGRAVLALLLLATLAWGYTRLPYSNKRDLWLFRRFGEATLAQLPPDAVVITHWEQGTTLQYLVLAERRRPDVLIDVVEPADEGWGTRARQRYAGRPVFFVGAPADVAALLVELVRADEYADLFRLREP